VGYDKHSVRVPAGGKNFAGEEKVHILGEPRAGSREKGSREKGRKGEREKGRKGEREKGRKGEREKGRRGEGEKGRRPLTLTLSQGARGT
jgi:hypothetical protein